MFLNKLNIINVSISRARDYLRLVMPDNDTENVRNLRLIKRVEALCKEQPGWVEHRARDLEKLMFGKPNYLEENSFSTSHQLVNVYGVPEKKYEVRSETSAVDVQVRQRIVEGRYKGNSRSAKLQVLGTKGCKVSPPDSGMILRRLIRNQRVGIFSKGHGPRGDHK